MTIGGVPQPQTPDARLHDQAAQPTMPGVTEQSCCKSNIEVLTVEGAFSVPLLPLPHMVQHPAQALVQRLQHQHNSSTLAIAAVITAAACR